ncbi:MAG: ATP-binding protein [Pseudomonadota bacterium]
MGRLFWKFFFAFWLALLLAGGVVGTVVWFHKRSVEENNQELAKGPPAMFLVKAASATLVHGGRQALLDLLEKMRDDPMAQLFVVDQTGHDLLGRDLPPAALEEARRRMALATPDPIAVRGRDPLGQEYLIFATARPPLGMLPGKIPPPPHGHLPYPPPDHAVRPGGQPPTPSPWVPMIAGLMASLGFSAVLAWYLAKPIRNLRVAFEEAARGDLDVRVAKAMGRRRDELADLGRDFDSMASRLRDLMETQRRLLHDVSHEIRSPLARLQAAIGLARQIPGEWEASLDRIERESDRLDALVGELLTLSRLEAGMGGAQRDLLDLCDVVGSVVEDARFEAVTLGRQVIYDCTGPLPMRCRGELLHRAVENVVRNALKFTPPNGSVEVRVGPGGPGWMSIIVADRGPGVPEQDLEAIFVPFYRDEAGAGVGFGLGLAIARRAVEAHGGTINARNRPGGGLEIRMHLPAGGGLDEPPEERRAAG